MMSRHGKQQSASQQAHAFQRRLDRDVAYRYLVHLPRGEQGRWPMILFLHGAGERGSDLEMIKVHGIPRIVEEQPDFPFITISPQCPAGCWWDDPDALMALVEYVLEEYPVDPRRVYLTGLSMGGFGAWRLAGRYPERFAAAVIVCGGGNPYIYLVDQQADIAERFRKLPIWVFHGDQDDVVPIEESRRMVGALEQIGAPVRFTIYKGVGHDSWTQTYYNPAIYEWLLQYQLP